MRTPVAASERFRLTALERNIMIVKTIVNRADDAHRVCIAFFFAVCLAAPFALAGDDTMEIRHELGTAVVKTGPKRIVTFDLSILDSMDRLGVKDASFAVPKQSIPQYLDRYKAEDVVDAGGMKEPNLELIYEFKPDVIFISARQTD